MALIDLKYKNCGATINMDDSREFGFCMYCGSKYSMKEELVRIAISHSGSVEVDKTKENINLLARAEKKY